MSALDLPRALRAAVTSGLLVGLVAGAAAVAAQPVPTWSEGPRHPVPRDHHHTFLLDDGDEARLCVAGGNTYASVMGDVWCADVRPDGSLEPWLPEPPLPDGQAGGGLVVTDEAVFIVSGRGGDMQSTPRTLVGRRDGARIAGWSEGPALPDSLFHVSAERVGDWVFAIGGSTGTEATDAVFRARLLSGGSLAPWEPARPLPAPRSHHASFAHGGALYVTGGLRGNPAGENTTLADVLRSRVSSDGTLSPWETVSSFDSTRVAHAAFAWDGHAFLVGGVESDTRLSDTVQRARLLPDGGLGPWERLDPLPLGRGHTHHTPLWRGHVYSVGGRSGRRVLGATHVGTFD